MSHENHWHNGQLKYRFRYGHWRTATVTVRAHNYNEAELKARGEMDDRYEKADMEPPVAWTLRLEHAEIVAKKAPKKGN